MARSSLIELFRRSILVKDRKDKIYSNGSDNDYPERVERVINSSVTAYLSVTKLYSFLYAQGISTKYGISDKAFKTICYDLAYQGGFFLHIGYNIDGSRKSVRAIPFKMCRVSEEDDFNNDGYVWMSDDWQNENVFLSKTKNNKKWFYPFNPDIDVINEQRKKDASDPSDPKSLIEDYRGQVLFVKTGCSDIYPNSFIDPVYNDADTEARISVYRNDRVKTGFIGATIAIIPECESDRDWKQKEQEFKDLLGAENACNLLLLEGKLDGKTKLSDHLHLETVESKVSTKGFEYDEKVIQENILNACYNLPKVLIKGSDGAMFGPTGDILLQSKEVFLENIDHLRVLIEKSLTKATGRDIVIDKKNINADRSQ